MAAILNGLLPLRKRDHHAQDRILNTRWGDASISAPIHGGWSAATGASDTSPDLDRDLPPTPPQHHDGQDNIYIVGHDEEDNHDSGSEMYEEERGNASITITLPWKKTSKNFTHIRKSSGSKSQIPAYEHSMRANMVPSLATAEAAAIPLPESRISSPVAREVVNNPLGRNSTTSPVMSFRSRLASPVLGDMLSPVVEGFAKSGPSSRSTPILSPLHYVQSVPLDRPPTASSTRSAGSRRPSLTSLNSQDNLGIAASSGAYEDRATYQRPPSRGLGVTAHMRASSRGPRAPSQGPRAASVEPFARQATPGEQMDRSLDSQKQEPVIPGLHDVEPVRRRAPSVEPARRRAPSVEPVSRRAPSVEPVRRRAPSVEPSSRRAASREPRGRRGFSIDPTQRRRHHSEAPKKLQRSASVSSNDGSGESESEREFSEGECWARFKEASTSSRRPRRRRSIASPISSPTASSFGITAPAAPPLDSIAARAGLVRPLPMGPPPVQRNIPRNRSKSRTRGLYADMHDDFRLLARDVRLNVTPAQMVKSPGPADVISPSTTIAPSPIMPTSQVFSPSITSPSSQRMPSPCLSTHSVAAPPPPPRTLSSGLAAAVALRLDPERTGYTSDSSLTGLPSISSTAASTFSDSEHNLTNANSTTPTTRVTDTHGGKALLAAMARERKDQLRREERERAREKVIRRLQRDRQAARDREALGISDCESVMSSSTIGTSYTAADKTRRMYGSTSTREFSNHGGYDSDASYRSHATGYFTGIETKELVKDAEEIWG